MASKKNVIIIDLDQWTTQAKKAEMDGVKLTTLSQRVVRTQKGKSANPIEYWHIPELGITLVKK